MIQIKAFSHLERLTEVTSRECPVRVCNRVFGFCGNTALDKYIQRAPARPRIHVILRYELREIENKTSHNKPFGHIRIA
jgi:hypothetical protein